MSASSIRLEQLRQTLGTMGILAHELRTPLATIALIGDAIRSEAQEPSPRTMQALEQLAGRLQAVARNMNRQIDMQISNAQLMCLPEDREGLSAEQVVRSAVAACPVPRGPFTDEADMRRNAHARAERGTRCSCWC